MQTDVHDKSIASCSLFHTRTPPSIFGDVFLWACSDHPPSTVLLSGNNRDNLPCLPHHPKHQNDLPTYCQPPSWWEVFPVQPHSAETQGKFPVHLIRFRIGPSWSSCECFFRLQYSQGTSRVKPAGLQGKGRSFFLPVKSCGMA